MKIILKDNIKGVGEKDQILDVSDGYAVNFLIPKNLASKAIKKDIDKIDENKKEKQQTNEDIEEKWFDLLKKLNREIVFEEKTNDKGVLFNSIGSDEISKYIAENAETTKRPEITIDENIKKIGDFYAIIKIGDKKIKITIRVKPFTTT